MSDKSKVEKKRTPIQDAVISVSMSLYLDIWKNEKLQMLKRKLI